MKLPESNPIGYSWLAARFGVVCLPYWRESRALVKGPRRLVETEGREIEYLPSWQNLGEDVFAHLEFGLRKEGLHLELLRKILVRIQADELAAHVRKKPTGRYVRVLWWLFEEFTGQLLNLPDLKTGNYQELLDPRYYITGPKVKIKRQRIDMNLLGTVQFSPMVRKKGLGNWEEDDLAARCYEIASGFPAEVFQRAIRYLCAKESKSSHEIEREIPNQRRSERFISILEEAWYRDFLTKDALVEIQREIVDSRYANRGWRDEIDEQVYVGQTLGLDHEKVHFIGAKPDDLEELMSAFLVFSERVIGESSWLIDLDANNLKRSWERSGTDVPTLVAAPVVSFVFNFLHPFSDGNGRIHRFLLHHVLAQRRFGPEGIILPVSAVILSRPRQYDQALESFSKPLMELVEYTMDDRQRMTVTNDTIDFYRYIDCTEICRITIDFIRETIETELPSELRYLTKYDEIREKMRDVVELPDRIARLFVSLCSQNGGRLSTRKRNLPEFIVLSDAEISVLETIVRDGLGIDTGQSDSQGDF